MEEGGEGLFGRVAGDEAPYRRAAIGLCGQRAEGVARLEGEGFLDRVDGGVVVVFDLAQLEEAGNSQRSFKVERREGTYFSQSLGA